MECMECYVLAGPKFRGYRKHMLSLCFNKGMLWLSEQKLVEQTKIVRRDGWMTQMAQRQKKWKGTQLKMMGRSADDRVSNFGEEVRYFDCIGSR